MNIPDTVPIRVLAVDDHPLVRDGVAAVLEDQPDMRLVAQASNGHDAVTLFREHRPDVTLMDLRMPDMSGVEAIAKIRSEHSSARIIVLTTYSGDAQAAAALKAGASGYLLKSLVRSELLATIRAVHGGDRRVPARVASEIAEHIADDALSEREIQILKRVADGWSNKAIGRQLGNTEHTVKFHMKSILAKLNARDRTHAVMIAIKRGFFDI